MESATESDSQCNGNMKTKYQLSDALMEELKHLPDVLDFITYLQNVIIKQKKKLKKYRHANKVKYRTAYTQTEPVDIKTKSITEEIAEAAQQTLEKNGFVYEETSGLYYDYNSGYYYNAEYGLYYDGNSGTYLKYNQDTKAYEFHSQVAISENDKKPSKRYKEPDIKHAMKRTKREIGLEEGECSDVSYDEEHFSDEDDDGDNECDLDYAKQWPPCMRIIVEETNLDSIKVGTLFLMTYDGGTLGREGQHSLLIPDINISKVHVKFHFDTTKNSYYITDMGSQNGTLLNGQRLSVSKAESEPTEIPHGSRIQVGGTILVCHIHPGTQTCGHCEPGLITTPKDETEQYANSNKSIEHKKQLKQLRKKFGILHGDLGKVNPGSGYTDRAQHRRETIGSQNPYEKTQSASLNESISSENKGFKLLSKMGWKEGQALGKDNQGKLEPVELVSNPGTSGIGSTNMNIVNHEASNVDRNKTALWIKTQERFKQIPETTGAETICEDIFNDI